MGVPSKRANLRTQNLLLSLALIPSEAVISKNKIKKSNKRRRKNANGMFKCKTCSREFSSFQALGGHSTSHLRPKVRFTGIDLDIGEKYNKEPTRHVCGLCDKEFSTGPALGGHMRLHRDRDRTLLPVMSSAVIRSATEDDLFEQIGSDQELGFDGVVVSVHDHDHDHDHESSPGRLLNLFE